MGEEDPASRVFPEPERDDASVTPEERRDLQLAARAHRTSSMVRQGRRIGGMPGAMMAGAMAALREIYEGPAKEEIPIVSESPDEPHDVDRDGLSWRFGEVAAETPPQPRTAPLLVRRRARRSRRR